jgi:hypothetical protein
MYKKYNSYQEQSEPYLDSSNFLEIKTNDNDNESEEEEDIKTNGLNNINICEKDEKNTFFRKFTPLKLSNVNKNGNYFLLRLKSIDDIKNKRINKGNINKIIGKNSLNEQYTKLIETQRLLSANRNSVRSAEKDSSINLNLNGLNLNKKYIYIRNLNIFSLNTNKSKTNRKKIKFNRVHLFQKDKINNEDEDKKNL